MSLCLKIRGELIAWDRPLCMGIINLTPDSFHAPSRASDLDISLKLAEKMLNQGADMIDIGAYSSRPGAIHISEMDEISRLKAVLPELRRQFPKAIISLDTFRSSVALAGADMGVDMINDISGGDMDNNMHKTVANLRIPYIAMHMRGTPQTMQNDLLQGDITPDVLARLSYKIRAIRGAGVADLIIDPGFGFGKSVRQNFELVNQLPALKTFGCPILVGVSRKSMIAKVIEQPSSHSLNATSALHVALLQGGANILRVHDVKEAIECVKIFQALSTS